MTNINISINIFTIIISNNKIYIHTQSSNHSQDSMTQGLQAEDMDMDNVVLDNHIQQSSFSQLEAEN